MRMQSARGAAASEERLVSNGRKTCLQAPGSCCPERAVAATLKVGEREK